MLKYAPGVGELEDLRGMTSWSYPSQGIEPVEDVPAELTRLGPDRDWGADALQGVALHREVTLDVDLRGLHVGVTADGLVVRKTKFQKSRLVPLHHSTVDALDRYLTIRRRCGAASDHLFVLSTGRAINPDIVTGVFVKLARQVGLLWRPRYAGPEAARPASLFGDPDYSESASC